MIKYEKENKVMAKECGVELDILQCAPPWFEWKFKHKIHTSKWTIEDARCREIIREKFQLTTDIRQDGSRYCYPRLDIDKAIAWLGNGKTIVEAEIACIIEICKAT